jgi:putative DNA primase/helicase
LNDRAADIWEPLLALADLAGGEWPGLARKAAIVLSAGAQDVNPITSLLIDIFVLFTIEQADRMSTHSLIAGLNGFGNRPWAELRKQNTPVP